MLGAYRQDSEATATKLISDLDDVVLNQAWFLDSVLFFVKGFSIFIRICF